MAKAKPKVQIPKFSANEIRFANACAVLIWNGLSYEDGSEITSDRDLLVYFSSEFQKLSKNFSSGFFLSRKSLHDLIIVALLKPMYRKQHELSYAKLDKFFRTNYSQYEQSIQFVTTSYEKVVKANDLVVAAAKAVVKNGVSPKAGYRVPFASRLLFFGAPDMFIFNYANRLAEKKLNYQARPHYAYPVYGRDMLQVLKNNWIELSKYNIPTEIANEPEEDITIAYHTHWWARRVLDLALLIRFRVFIPISNPYQILKDLKFNQQSQSLCPKP